jgi:beta-glucuronidase
MIRAFEQHHLRVSRLLDGFWQFVQDPDDEGKVQEWHKRFPAGDDTSYVPGCWNNDLGRYSYEGVAWYRTTFTLPEKMNIRLIFHAVLGFADIYLDGEFLGAHYGGFTPFEFILKDWMAGVHELIVRCDNRHSRQTIPLDRVDWFHYGGIIRSVELQRLPDIFIEKMVFTYELKERAADIQCRVTLRSLRDVQQQQKLVLKSDGQPFHEETVTLPDSGSAEVVVSQSWPDVRLWQLGKAELYTITAATDQDDLSERVGFRTVTTSNHRVCLNGQPVYLQGVNRHEEHPEWGFAGAEFPLPDEPVLA